MAIRKYRPTTPSNRAARLGTYPELTDKRPEKNLTTALKRTGGRSRGRLSVRGHGGGHKRLYRIIDFKRHDKIGVPAEVFALEYDPNRSAHIALLKYNDGEKRYIIAPEGLAVGMVVQAGSEAKIKVGNALPLESIPVGTAVHNIELKPGQGGVLARSAGNLATVMAKDDEWVHVKLKSGEVRRVPAGNFATIGQVSNVEHARIVLGKAGRSRHLGIRPTVRGVAMPAGEHAHGGGEGRTGTGRVPRTYKGKLAFGVRTRKRNKHSNRFIVQNRRGAR